MRGFSPYGRFPAFFGGVSSQHVDTDPGSDDTGGVLDLPRLDRIRLTPRPLGQRVVALGMLMPNYNLPPRTRIDLEGAERLPDEPVIYAMNHTDRYNYWPFQYRLWRSEDRFTATWVKGKYYENRFVGRFMELTNNIPTVSRGYLIARDFLGVFGRPPQEAEYVGLRKRVDRAAGIVDDAPEREALGAGLAPLFESPRDMLGRPFDPARERWEDAVNALFRAMMDRFVTLNARAFEVGLDLLVFPQGTRSKRLSRGHVGLAQVALKFQRTIVPVGCNGSDVAYPGSSPLARGGHVVYRIGEPLTHDGALAPFQGADFAPFTAEAERAHRERFQGLVDLVMDRIDGLLDEPYRFAPDKRSDGVAGTSRFL